MNTENDALPPSNTNSDPALLSSDNNHNRVMYKFQRFADKYYLRINYTLPDSELLKNDLNASIAIANYSDFYWKWKALSFDKAPPSSLLSSFLTITINLDLQDALLQGAHRSRLPPLHPAIVATVSCISLSEGPPHTTAHSGHYKPSRVLMAASSRVCRVLCWAVLQHHS